jgi:hypothetical protein
LHIDAEVSESDSDDDGEKGFMGGLNDDERKVKLAEKQR